jgi:hypothetical protein
MIRLGKTGLFLAGFAVIVLCYFIRQLTFVVISERTTGEVISVSNETRRSGNRHSYRTTSLTYPIVRFYIEGEQVIFKGESNLEYVNGDKVDVLYEKDDPSEAKIYTFFGFWFGKAVWFGVVALVWLAFSTSYLDKGEYLTLNFREQAFGKSKHKEDKGLDGDWNDRMKLE